MYYSARAITGFRASASDGTLGRILGFVFNDRDWQVQYLIVRRGLIFGRHILVEPESVKWIDGTHKRVYLDLPRSAMSRRPDIDDHPPVGKLEERMQFARYQGHQPPDWHLRRVAETHLRDTSEITGYRILTENGPGGKVVDVILDTENWKIHQLAARRGWWWNKPHLIPPEWVEDIDWAQRSVQVHVEQEEILSSQEFDPRIQVNKTHEVHLVDYEGKSCLRQREEVSEEPVPR